MALWDVGFTLTANIFESGFNPIYNLEAVEALLKIYMGLALVRFQKYLLLNVNHIFLPSFVKRFDKNVVKPNTKLRFLKIMYPWLRICVLVCNTKT